MKYYIFVQNNSGGKFSNEDGLGEYVYIQAKNYNEANTIAETKGIYFNGCERNIDCNCCGDRWSALSEYSKTLSKQELEEAIVGKQPFYPKNINRVVYKNNGKFKKYLNRKLIQEGILE